MNRISNQTTFLEDTQSLKVFPDKILSSKGSDALEPRIEFLEYNANGRPTLIKQTNGTLIHYRYNLKGQVMRKIINHTLPDVTLSISQGALLETDVICNFIKENFPNSQVTYYFYDKVTNLLNRIIDPRCYETTYTYDEYQRLQFVKDAEGNILSENDYNYRPQTN